MLLSTLQGINADGNGKEILPLAHGQLEAQKKALKTIRRAYGKHGDQQFKELLILSNRGILAHVRCAKPVPEPEPEVTPDAKAEAEAKAKAEAEAETAKAKGKGAKK